MTLKDTKEMQIGLDLEYVLNGGGQVCWKVFFRFVKIFPTDIQSTIFTSSYKIKKWHVVSI